MTLVLSHWDQLEHFSWLGPKSTPDARAQCSPIGVKRSADSSPTHTRRVSEQECLSLRLYQCTRILKDHTTKVVLWVFKKKQPVKQNSVACLNCVSKYQFKNINKCRMANSVEVTSHSCFIVNEANGETISNQTDPPCFYIKDSSESSRLLWLTATQETSKNKHLHYFLGR